MGSAATDFARAVVDGRVIAGELQRAACRRHLADLERADLVWDQPAADHAVGFIQQLCHYKDRWAGLPFTLEPWQRFIVESLFAWRRKSDGRRRFQQAYVEIARKNGKSELLAGIALYLLLADGQRGADIYTAATTRDQARMVWNAAAHMVRATPGLDQLVTTRESTHRLTVPATFSKIEALASEASSLHGLDVAAAVIDEVHVHADGELWDTLETGMGARSNPLLVGITTAGESRVSFCGQLRAMAERVVTGDAEADDLLVFICCPDEADHWTSEVAWAKANPNLGVSVELEELQRACDKAMLMPLKRRAFQRLRVNLWVTGATSVIELPRWDEAVRTPADQIEERREGARGYVGIDLSSTTDLSAVVIALEPDTAEAPVDLVVRLYMPQDRVDDPAASKADRADFALWAAQGWIVPTPGDTIDYRFIESDLVRLAEVFELQSVSFDPYNAVQFTQQLADKLPQLPQRPVRQTFVAMSPPTKEFLRLVLMRQIDHGGHPVLRWMAGNLTVRRDANENVAPDKKRARNRIDGMVAAILAVDGLLRGCEDGDEMPDAVVIG